MWMMHAGSTGVSPNREKALRYLREACESKEHPAACYYLVRVRKPFGHRFAAQ